MKKMCVSAKVEIFVFCDGNIDYSLYGSTWTWWLQVFGLAREVKVQRADVTLVSDSTAITKEFFKGKQSKLCLGAERSNRSRRQ